MNLEDKLHHLDEFAAGLDSTNSLNSAAASKRSRYFWLQITAALLIGAILAVGTMLLLSHLGLFTDMTSLPERKRPQVLAPATPAALPLPATAPLALAAEGAVPAATTTVPEFVPSASSAPPVSPTVSPLLTAPTPAGAVTAASVTPVSPPALATASASPPSPPTIAPAANANADRQALLDKQMLENLAVAVDALNLKVLELEKINMKKAKAAQAAAQQMKVASAEKVPVARSRREELALPIFAISATGVLISDKGKPRLVPPGEKLPGGMTFLNFDPVTRRMKTDQGEFDIPVLTP